MDPKNHEAGKPRTLDFHRFFYIWSASRIECIEQNLCPSGDFNAPSKTMTMSYHIAFDVIGHLNVQ